MSGQAATRTLRFARRLHTLTLFASISYCRFENAMMNVVPSAASICIVSKCSAISKWSHARSCFSSLFTGGPPSESFRYHFARMQQSSCRAKRVRNVDLRMRASSRIALADCLISATAVMHGATLVHRDPHFGVLPAGLPNMESLPLKMGYDS